MAPDSAVRRSPRNKIARVLMEGYDWTHDHIRFNLQTADMALDALKDAGYVVIPTPPTSNTETPGTTASQSEGRK